MRATTSPFLTAGRLRALRLRAQWLDQPRPAGPAEVVRNLAIRENEKGLSTGEKQMFTRTKKILASELMYALDKDEEEAENYLDELLADSANSQMAMAGAK